MRRGGRTVAALGLAVGALFASEADACSRPFRNAFADYGEPPAADLMRTARYIDWVEVVAVDGPGCERDRLLSEAEWEALDAAEAADTGPPRALDPPPRTSDGYVTRSCWFNSSSPFRALRAKVISPVRGGGSADFPLAWAWDGSGAPDHAYSDPRVVTIEAEPILRDQYEAAVKIHGDPAFLDHGELTRQLDFSDSCGGAPTAIIGGRYLAFRSKSGAVLALEPIATLQDPWFQRVVAYAARPITFSRPTLDVAAFVAGSRGAAVLRIRQCRRSRDGDPEVQGDLLRGSFDAGQFADIVSVQTDENSTMIGPREDGPSFNWLVDYAERIGARCSAGDEWLLLSGPYDRDGASPPRAARITGGRVRTSDLISGYRLVGPARVAVDDVFAWVEKGRVARDASP